MAKQSNDQNDEKYWSIAIGLYPGVLIGYRAYEEKDFTTHVIYLPFIDFAIEIEH